MTTDEFLARIDIIAELRARANSAADNASRFNIGGPTNTKFAAHTAILDRKLRDAANALRTDIIAAGPV